MIATVHLLAVARVVAAVVEVRGTTAVLTTAPVPRPTAEVTRTDAATQTRATTGEEGLRHLADLEGRLARGEAAALDTRARPVPDVVATGTMPTERSASPLLAADWAATSTVPRVTRWTASVTKRAIST